VWFVGDDTGALMTSHDAVQSSAPSEMLTSFTKQKLICER
jgi:hypothetical protein